MSGRAIDWPAVHARLRMAREALERAEHPDEQRIRQVFRRRAQAFAASRVPIRRPDIRQVLSFMAGEERYGLELSALARVERLSGCSRLGGLPAHVTGVASIGGVIRPIHNLSVLLTGAVAFASDPSYILMLSAAHQNIVFQVDRLEGVQEADMALLSPAPSSPSASVRPVIGVTRDQLILLDASRLVDMTDIQEVSAS